MDTTALDEISRVQWMKASVWLRRHPGVLGRDAFYTRLRDGSIPCLKVGRSVLVPDDLLDRMLAEARQGNERGHAGALDIDKLSPPLAARISSQVYS